MVKALEAENDKLEEQKDTKQDSYDKLERQYDDLETEHTILTGQYKFLENANRSLALDGKQKLAEQRHENEKTSKKRDAESQREKEALELRITTLEEALARIQAAGSPDQQYTDSTASGAFGRLSVDDDMIHDAGGCEGDTLIDNEKGFGDNGEDIVMSNTSGEGIVVNNASDKATFASSDQDGDKDMQDLLSSTSAKNEDAQDRTLANTERLHLSVNDLRLSFETSTKAIPDTIFVVAVSLQWKDPDTATAREITEAMVTMSNESKERVKRWGTALKNVEDTCITKLCTMSNRAWTHNFPISNRARDPCRRQSEGHFEIFEE